MQKTGHVTAKRIATAIFASTLIVVFGCSGQPFTDTTDRSHDINDSAETESRADHFASVITKDVLPEELEYWDAVYVGGTPVGHTVTRLRHPSDKNDEIQIDIKTEIAIQRFGTETRQTMSVHSIESSDFRIKSAKTMMSSGNGRVECEIRDTGKQLEIVSRSGGQLTTTHVPSDCLGVIAVELDLRRRPLRPGETREYRQFIPFMNSIANVQLEAKGMESTPLLDGDRSLLRIENEMILEGGNRIRLTMWSAEDGEILKTDMAALQTTYRTSQRVATAKESTKEFDLGIASLVKVNKELVDPHQTSKISYIATLHADGPLDAYFDEGASQSLRVINDHQIEIVVRALRPDNVAERNEVTPAAEYLNPNSLIQSTASNVIELAEKVPNGDSTWQTVCSLEKFVGDIISAKDFSTAFASASEVAATKTGDCTEHAVLLCALCRVKQIPSRCAVGLVYYPRSQAFAYHMWTEAWVDGWWIPLDATLGMSGIGAAHIKVADTSLADGTGMESMLPVIQLIGKLKLEIVDVERNLN